MMKNLDTEHNEVSILKEPGVIVLAIITLAIYVFALGISVGRFLF